MQKLVEQYLKISLVLKIAVAILLGLLLAMLAPDLALDVGVLGSLFVRALTAIAPILVFVLVVSALANQRAQEDSHLRPLVIIYLVGTFVAALTAVLMSFAFPVTLILTPGETQISPPSNMAEVLESLLFRIVSNPLLAIAEGNYIGILAWGIGFGLLLRSASSTTKSQLEEWADAVTGIVKFIIQLAPFGIFGLVASTIAKTGIEALINYSQLLSLLLGTMLIMALIVNPLIVFVKTRKNPYPLVLTCLRESGVTAFFTRSSAANIPINMQLCERLQLDEDTYSVSIPLGATINMGGAAVTITVMTLAAAHTLGIHLSLLTAFLLSAVAALSACGASGVAGGSLLLIPLACALFGIPNEIAVQVVAVGFIVGVLQDSAETALNSSTDVVFTAAATGEWSLAPSEISEVSSK